MYFSGPFRKIGQLVFEVDVLYRCQFGKVSFLALLQPDLMNLAGHPAMFLHRFILPESSVNPCQSPVGL